MVTVRRSFLRGVIPSYYNSMSVCILLAPSILLARPPGSPKHGDAQADRDRKREEPPCRLHAIVGQQGGDGQRDDNTRGDGPVVADDEVVPEPQEGLHELSTAGRAWRWRRTATRPLDSRRTKASTPMIEASLPGHFTPAPSAPQKMPKVVSITPTANFMVFS